MLEGGGHETAIEFESGAPVGAGGVAGAGACAGGSTVVDGTVNEKVRAVGGKLTLGDGALVRGDVTTHHAAFRPLPGAAVLGRVEGGGESPVQFSLPSNLQLPVGTAARAALPRDPFGGVMRSLALGLLAAVLLSLIALGAMRATRFGGRAAGGPPLEQPRATVPQP